MPKLLRSAGLVATGAVLAHLYDPDRGKARRARLRDQARARARGVSRAAERRLNYQAGRLEGMAARAGGHGTYTPEGDVDLREHLHQVLAESRIDARKVNVEVVSGSVTLRGQVAYPQEIQAAAATVAGVPGVVEVRSYLHLPGAPAPNKAEALKAS